MEKGYHTFIVFVLLIFWANLSNAENLIVDGPEQYTPTVKLQLQISNDKSESIYTFDKDDIFYDSFLHDEVVTTTKVDATHIVDTMTEVDATHTVESTTEVDAAQIVDTTTNVDAKHTVESMTKVDASHIVESTTKVAPTVDTSPKVAPTVDTSPKVAPSVSTSTKVAPSVSTSTKVAPSVDTSTKVVPTVTTSTKVVPSVATTTKVVPTVSTSTKVVPTVATTTKVSPLVTTTTKVSPSIATTPKNAHTVDTSHAVEATHTVDTKILPLSLKFYISINKSLPTNETEKDKLKSEFNKTLTKVFKDLDGFKEIVVLRLRSGSVICDYKIVFKSGTNLNSINTKFNEKVVALSREDIYGAKMNTSNLINAFNVYAKTYKPGGDACQLYDDLAYCKVGYKCNITTNGEAKCESKCKDYNCGRGQCVFDPSSDTLSCRCPADDNHVYSGEHCETGTEKLSLSKDWIIAISVSCGVVVVIAFSVIVVVLCVRIYRFNNSSSKDSNTQDVVGKSDLGQSFGRDNFTYESVNRISAYNEKKPHELENRRRAFDEREPHGMENRTRAFDGKEHPDIEMRVRAYAEREPHEMENRRRAYDGREPREMENRGRAYDGKEPRGMENRGRAYDGREPRAMENRGRAYDGREPREIENSGRAFDGREPREMSSYFQGRQYAYPDNDSSKAYMYSPRNQPMNRNYNEDYTSNWSSLSSVPATKVEFPRLKINRW